jgi:2-polyprenyl-6-methoxyphenol hydroxylase-like FAD-dependent oxidoreductase
MTKSRTSVLIVGAGPVGLALAGDLGWRGDACTLIERTDGAISAPKMDMVGIRTMEHCQVGDLRLGLALALSTGLPAGQCVPDLVDRL